MKIQRSNIEQFYRLIYFLLLHRLNNLSIGINFPCIFSVFYIAVPVGIFPGHYSSLLPCHKTVDLNLLSMQIACLPLRKKNEQN